MTRWLVDGMNVIGSRPDRWWAAPDRGIRALVDELRAFASATGDAVTVVFDFRPEGLRLGARGGVKALFADGEPQAADDMIARMVEEEGGGVRVVTSDRVLRQRVTAAGGTVEPVSQFRRRLEQDVTRMSGRER